MASNTFVNKTPEEASRPNGPVAAALLAGGIGIAVLGLMTVLAEASASIAKSLTWLTAVGPLSGKTGWGAIAYFASWLILYLLLGKRNVNFKTYATAALILLALGILFTFPPFFMLFAAE